MLRGFRNEYIFGNQCPVLRISESRYSDSIYTENKIVFDRAQSYITSHTSKWIVVSAEKGTTHFINRKFVKYNETNGESSDTKTRNMKMCKLDMIWIDYIVQHTTVKIVKKDGDISTMSFVSFKIETTQEAFEVLIDPEHWPQNTSANGWQCHHRKRHWLILYRWPNASTIFNANNAITIASDDSQAALLGDDEERTNTHQIISEIHNAKCG